MDPGPSLDSQRDGAVPLTAGGPRRATIGADDWSRLQTAFDTLADLPPVQRAQRLDRLDLPPGLRERLAGMLAAHDASGILDGAPPTPAAPTPADYASLPPGTGVGAFAIDRLIARGGMGEVYLAHRKDADFDQAVALKLLRPEAAGRFKAFAAERRMLAGLEHPGVARLIDGGVAADGRPFMAMEYVEGEEIDRWRIAHSPDLATRLRLFLEVCDAVSYAHGRLTIHRDIKPANILVDRQGRARLLDFGIARLLDLDDDGRAPTILLTPQYAAPEQLAGEALTVATDIYALGAVLYELLAGHGPWTPTDGEAAMPTVLRRVMHDDPPPPSRAADGGIPAARISGDLDAIVLKAMRNDPAQRYSSVEALADDVRRFQGMRPVTAREGAAGYRVRRYLVRNRWGVAAVSAIVVAVIGGLIGTSWQARRAVRQRDIAQAEAERTEAVNQAMMLMFRDANDQGRTDSITARELIDSTARRLVGSLDPKSPRSASIVSALSDLYVLTEDLPSSQALLEQALARHVGAGDAVGVARLKLRLAQAYAAQKRFAEGRRLLADAATVWASDPERYRVDRMEAASAEAYMLRLEGKPDEGIALLQKTMPEAELAYGLKSRDLFTRYANLSTHLVMAGRIDEARSTITHAERLIAAAGQTRTPASLTLMQLQASLAARDGRLADAAGLYREVAATRRSLFGRSAALGVDLLQLGRILVQLGRPAEALSVLDEAEPMIAQYFGAKGAPVTFAALGRAEALIGLGRLTEAQRVLKTISPEVRQAAQPGVEQGTLALVEARLAVEEGRTAYARRRLGDAKAIFTALGPAGAGYAPSVAKVQQLVGSAP